MRIALTLASWVFLKAFWIRENGGNLQVNVCVNSSGPVSMTCTVGTDKTGMKQKHLLDFLITCVIYLCKCHGAKFLLAQVLCMQSFPYANHCECQERLALISQLVLFTLTYFLLYIDSPLLQQNKKLLRSLFFLANQPQSIQLYKLQHYSSVRIGFNMNNK